MDNSLTSLIEIHRRKTRTEAPGMDTDVIQPAGRELVALAVVMRPEWDCNVLSSALVAAKNAGWTWTRTFKETARMLTDEHATPWDLKRAAASPLQREEPPPGAHTRGAALARELLTAIPATQENT